MKHCVNTQLLQRDSVSIVTATCLSFGKPSYLYALKKKQKKTKIKVLGTLTQLENILYVGVRSQVITNNYFIHLKEIL